MSAPHNSSLAARVIVPFLRRLGFGFLQFPEHQLVIKRESIQDEIEAFAIGVREGTSNVEPEFVFLAVVPFAWDQRVDTVRR